MGLNVLLVNANRMKPAVAPIGLDYVAQALDAAGHHVELLDLCFVPDAVSAIGKRFAAGRPGPDLVGLTVRNTDDCYFASQESFSAPLPRGYRRATPAHLGATRARRRGLLRHARGRDAAPGGAAGRCR